MTLTILILIDLIANSRSFLQLSTGHMHNQYIGIIICCLVSMSSATLSHFLAYPSGTTGVIRIRIWKKSRQHNGQKKKDKQRSTKRSHKTKDRVTRTPLKTGDELGCSGRVSSSCSTSDARRVNLVTNPVISHE